MAEKKYNLYANIKIGDETKTISIVNTDLRSMEIYFSFCTDFNHFINTIRYTNSKSGREAGKIEFDSNSSKVSNFIDKNLFSTSLKIEGGVPIFYNKDRDIVLATKDDIKNVINGIHDEDIIYSLFNFLNNQLNVKEEKDLSDLLDLAYDNYELWLSFNNFLKNMIGKRLITASPNMTLDEEYRKRIDDLNYHEGHLSIYNQIIENLLPYASLNEKLRKEKKEKQVIEPKTKKEIAERKYKMDLIQKQIDESIAESEAPFDDFLGPSKANDSRYHSIN